METAAYTRHDIPDQVHQRSTDPDQIADSGVTFTLMPSLQCASLRNTVRNDRLHHIYLMALKPACSEA